MNILSALQAGYTPEKILKYISKIDPDLALKINTGLQAGHSIEKILNYLSQIGDKVSSLLGKGSQQSSNMYQRAQSGIHPFIRGAAQGAGILGAGALGSYALGRALPQATQAIIPEVLPAMEQANQPLGLPNLQKQIPHEAQKQIEVQPQIINPPEPPTPNISQPKEQLASLKNSPLPESLQKQISNLAEIGNNVDQIEGYLQKFHPKEVKAYEKATSRPIKETIDNFVSQIPRNVPNEKAKVAPISGETPQTLENAKEIPIEPQEQKKLEPLIKELDVSKEKAKGKTVALPNGEIGEITNIRQGIATVNSNGKEYRRKIEELIEPPIPEKDLAELHDELMKGIEKKTGQEISRMVNWAGYDPKTNELAFVPHMGALYIYDNISPTDASELTNLLTQRKSIGENFIGAWSQGSQSPIGAAMSKLIQKLQKERGGKGQEYKGKYEKIYDAIEPAKIASKQKFEEKESIKKAEKKLEKEKQKKEKENVKKRKTKKPRLD